MEVKVTGTPNIHYLGKILVHAIRFKFKNHNKLMTTNIKGDNQTA